MKTGIHKKHTVIPGPATLTIGTCQQLRPARPEPEWPWRQRMLRRRGPRVGCGRSQAGLWFCIGLLWMDEILLGTTLKPWLKPLFVGMYRGIMIPGALGAGFRPSTE